jgi:hypothetical protein
MDKNYTQLSIAHADENNEQQMDFVEYGYTKDSNDNDIIINNDNIALVIYEKKMTTMKESFQTLILLKR